MQSDSDETAKNEPERNGAQLPVRELVHKTLPFQHATDFLVVKAHQFTVCPAALTAERKEGKEVNERGAPTGAAK